ncbi:aldose 1-epimerase family protein [Algoriphagus chordae]|uniref:Galactose mutarotase-like enzyme n=1 Tax=Algoriphagus chordae TaxID=237019 RepID=A0A2W7QZT8_9BACT|nr:aldose 1-epimerase family protein [Algoriphagus chordae]PZX54063.1 galactose mutarotase-like enzyme [Algoriphagus chordae]
MIHQLESEELSISVNQTGIELSSIKSKSSQVEYLWQGNPSIWSGQSPILFPIIGALKDGYMIYKEQKYRMPKHGFLRHSTKPILKASTDNSLLFSLSWDEESLLQYPFKFEFEVEFRLKGKTIEIAHHISNHGDESMYYSVGGHPAFNCPLQPGESYEEYSLEFSQPETDAIWLVNDDGLISDRTQAFLENSCSIQLQEHIFDKDALIFKNLKSREVTLTHKDKGAILRVKFDDFDYLGIWAKPGAPFVCIEPWIGIGDSSDSNNEFEAKEGLLKLEPMQTETKSYSIRVLD